MKKLIILFFLIILLLACSQNKEMLAQKNSDLQAQSIALQDSLSNLKQAIDKISAGKFEELEKSVIYLEEKTNQLEEQLDFYTNRFENIIDIITANSRKIDGITDGRKKDFSAEPTKSTEINIKPDILYAQARNYYLKRDLRQAQIKFNEFLQKYPKHELVINCSYWLAEIDYDEGRYAESISKFQEISSNSLNPEKSIDSLFKIAIINKKLGNYDLALSQAKEISDKFSDYIRINKVKAFIKDLE